MFRKIIRYFVLLGCCGTIHGLCAQTTDSLIVQKIKAEGMLHSKVMEHAFYLTDVNGPRLTNSPGLKKAEEWAVQTLKQWGLKNVNLEPFGDYGYGWQIRRSYIAMTAPYYHALIGVPRAWSGSTEGLTQSDVVLISPDSSEIKKYKDKLRDKAIIFDTNDTLSTSFTPDAYRLTAADIAAMDTPLVVHHITSKGRITWADKKRIDDLLFETGASIVLRKAWGKHGTVFTGWSADYAVDAHPVLPDMEVSGEDYLRMVRLLKAGHKVTVEADIQTSLNKETSTGYNVIAEIPGTDPKLKHEVVMLGAHIDSWHGATGATDNAAGVAVVMEAMRILKKLDIAPKRTIRLALWSGEEEGLWGSKGYVANHFGDKDHPKPEYYSISAYYNLDNGAGKIRGIYMQANPAVKPIFEKWLEPFHDLGAVTVANRIAISTDHIPFDAVGIPGFQFVQDKLEYFPRTHHSNQDTYDRLIADDLRQASVVLAAFVFNTAQYPVKIPRKKME
ncbi:M20/M25/M40 family metallo-hydrolase [Pedobacter sp. BS3]|uniref:M20/M25/M40 family metallo-hydrolase n=1 Tax=Pedobacter sp. BS3 TaxID=2567937 RepID=UPI0011EBAAA9|nr:M20/M25/M40 family metallo-hydrolase [Pedobacter sp. BS3]TZF82666.1 M20/M25/M40 family metallo-hydrolase [Pedobacter sp. BS3]